MPMITPYDISIMRLQNQQIANSKFKTPAALVRYMGAMQAQNYNMVKYATGLRIPDATKEQVERALNSGKLIRTHVLRPTWHLVTADALTPMLQITAPRILSSMRSRDRQLGLTAKVLKKCFDTLCRSLENHPGKRRDELLKDLNSIGIETKHDNRAAHILASAELNRIICSGKEDGKQNTYALYQSRIPDTPNRSPEQITEWLAEKYFTGHGPATVEDFAWWSGLTLTDVRNAVAALSAKLDAVIFRDKTYWFRKGTDRIQVNEENAYLIPAFDELVVSYKDRSAIFKTKDKKKAISSNGIFWPVILLNGQVTGLWKPIAKKNILKIETTLFRRHTVNEKSLIREAAGLAGTFYQKEVDVCF